MSKAKKLSKKQQAVIEDLFASELDEQAVLSKHKVSRNLYNRWLADQRFAEQFNEHIARSYRQSQLIIARYAPLAAAKLVQLTESDSQETARKACLDIISMGSIGDRLAGTPLVPVEDSGSRGGLPDLSAEAASRLLTALADDG